MLLSHYGQLSDRELEAELAILSARLRALQTAGTDLAVRLRERYQQAVERLEAEIAKRRV